MFRVCLFYAVLSVPCSLVVACWEMAALLAFLCVKFSGVLSLSHIVLIHIRTKGEFGTFKHV